MAASWLEHRQLDSELAGNPSYPGTAFNMFSGVKAFVFSWFLYFCL